MRELGHAGAGVLARLQAGGEELRNGAAAVEHRGDDRALEIRVADLLRTAPIAPRDVAIGFDP